MSTTEPHWFKSSYSGGGGGNCVEIAICPDAVLVRDSKDALRRGLTVSPGAWSAFAVLAASSHL
ncbi:DUF397 domain-containing protein [Streptomyces sp. NPDC048565]|uniref:DUF397 domain-containing protein n=1 Tax=Streptomyces sp. NPDC048565 TaxID=3155266 RepID=UPI00342D533F